ncbi:MAG TPA: alpha-amylase family glycosyl hydrolase [Kofleriaceae bacterium]|nr:alpha-amylase family glycosyl hydrolase [Kofleriaceae bacterium]
MGSGRHRSALLLAVAFAAAWALPSRAAHAGSTRPGARPAAQRRAAVRARPPRRQLQQGTRRVELDWIHHTQPELGSHRTIKDVRDGDHIERTVVEDGPVDTQRASRGRIKGGRFQRTITRQRLPVRKGARPWTDAEAPHLFSRAPQGVRYDVAGGEVAVATFQPFADAVELVIEGESAPRALEPTASGMWQLAMRTPPSLLHGKEYHFRVTRKGKTERVADPMADFTEYTAAGRISRFVDLEYTWGDHGWKAPPLEDIVIYEAQLAALSRHPSSGVAPEERGTIRGAMATQVMQRIVRLGVALELLPVHAADALMGGDWGYWATSFRALNERLSSPKGRLRTNRDMKELIDSYHQAGVPVIFDVVYNHGGELVMRALGEEIVYRARDEHGNYPEGWPTIRSEHPMMREMIVQTLQNWAQNYHVDGFRFDLGALHDKHTMREIARRLPKRTYLFSEPWALGPTKWSKGDLRDTFRDTRWAVWNDDFREPLRTFVTGKAATYKDRDKLKTAIRGAYSWAARPQQAVNYFSVHDGKTQADVLDGDKVRQFSGIALTLFSQGVPMIAEGTEFMHSKGGAHNSYDDPSVNQLDYDRAKQHEDLTAATADMIALRRSLPHFKYRQAPREGRDIDWIHPTGYPHTDNVNALGYTLRAPQGAKTPPGFDELVVLTNGSHGWANFKIPNGLRVIADGVTTEVDIAGVRGRTITRGEYDLAPGATAVLAR